MDVLNLDHFKNSRNRIEKVGDIRTIYWPVAVYRIMLPTFKDFDDIDEDNKLNPFEKVVLKLVDVLGNTASEEEISELTCLEIDTVRFIVLKLKDRGFIDENLKLIDDKRKLWDRKEYLNSNENIDYGPAIIFKELYSGNLFPFIYSYNGFNAFKKEELNQNYLRIKINKGFETPLSGEEVVRVYKSMHKHKVDYNERYHIPKLNQIRIEDSIEKYYLPCEIVILQNNLDYRILNPFQKGYSRFLEIAFDKLVANDEKYKKWLDKLYEILADNRIKYNDDFGNNDNSFWKNHSCRNYYEQLINCLTPNKNKQNRDITKIYASIEWALYYYCLNKDFYVAIDNIQFINPDDFNSTLTEIAEKYGFEIEKNYDNKPQRIFFPYINPNKLKQIRLNNIKPDYNSMISVALLLDENNNLGIKQLAKKIPNFLWKMSDLRESRNKEGHEKKEFSIEDIQLSYDSFMQNVVSILLPEVEFPKNSDISSKIKFDKKNIGISLTAKHNIRTYFSNIFNKMSETLKDRLFGAETFYVSNINNDKFESLEFIIHLYAALQITLSQKNNELLSEKQVEFGNFIELAENKIKNLGFACFDESLKSVSHSGIKNTLRGEDYSLGASLIAFILLSDDESLSDIYSRFPNFLEFIAEIITCRGHGNSEIYLSKSNIEQMRKNAYLAIETLMEV